MLFIRALILFGGTFLIGFLLATIFRVTNQIEKIGLSYLLGSGWLTLVVMILNAVGKVQFSAILTLSCVLLSILFFSLLHFVFTHRLPSLWPITPIKQRFSSLEKLLLIALIGIVGFSFMKNLLWPISDWDALALYDFRAKVLVAKGSWESGIALGYFFQYPPYTSLLHAMGYILGIDRAKVWYSLIYSSFLLVFYSQLRRKTSRLMSLSGALLIACTPLLFEHATMAYTNLAYTTFLVLGIIYFWLAGETNSSVNDWCLGIILVALSMWVRLTDPFWVIGLALLLIAMVRFALWYITLGGWGILVSMRKFWQWLVDQLTKNVVKIPAEATYTPVSQSSPSSLSSLIAKFIPLQYLLFFTRPLDEQVTHILKVISYLGCNIWPLFNYLLLPWLITSWYDFRHRKWYRLLIMNGTLLLVLGMITGGTYIFSYIFATWDQIGGSATRMSMFLVPLIWYYVISSQLWLGIPKTYGKNHRH